MQKSKITARIPLQSPPNGGDSFSPGEAKGAPAPVLQITIYLINKDLTNLQKTAMIMLSQQKEDQRYV